MTYLPGIYRIKPDWKLAVWNFMSRALWKLYKRLPFPPATYRFNGGRGTVHLAPSTVTFLTDLNTPSGWKPKKKGDLPPAVKFLKVRNSGWINITDGKNWPVQELGFEGELVEVLTIDNGWGYIRTLVNGGPMPSPRSYDPCVMHQFKSVTRQNTYLLPDVGRCLILVICNKGEFLRVRMSDLEYVREKL